jgi:hypothetical protein
MSANGAVKFDMKKQSFGKSTEGMEIELYTLTDENGVATAWTVVRANTKWLQPPARI